MIGFQSLCVWVDASKPRGAYEKAGTGAAYQSQGDGTTALLGKGASGWTPNGPEDGIQGRRLDGTDEGARSID